MRFSPQRLIRSFGFAWEGIAHVGRSQQNWRIHVAIAAIAIALGLALQISLIEWVALSLTIGLVLGFECLNTAVEAAVDALNAPPSLPAKYAKDTAAGAVLVMAITAVVVGGLIFLPKLLDLARLA
jgi:diacylglycerol kinase (ATP)